MNTKEYNELQAVMASDMRALIRQFQKWALDDLASLSWIAGELTKDEYTEALKQNREFLNRSEKSVLSSS